MNSNIYNTNLTTLINSYKNKLPIFLKDFTIAVEIYQKIKEIFKQVFLLNQMNIYFLKSFFTLLLPFDKYESFNNGILRKIGNNSTFTIANVINSKNKKNEKLFIKIIKKELQIPYYYDDIKDLLIFDIITAIIFDYIFKNDISCNQYKILIPDYKYALNSYLKYDYMTDKEYWDYNDLINYNKQNSLSPYSFNNILSKKSPYNAECFMVIYEAINNPIDIIELFNNFHKKPNEKLKNNILNFFKQSCQIYHFIKDIGIKYGFMHNDLHFGNLIYDEYTHQLYLIDFGRASFAKFIYSPIKEINDKVYNEFIKLSYNDIILDINEHNRNDVLKNLYDKYSFIENEYSIIISYNNKFFSIIFDLMTFASNLYLKLLYFLKTQNPEEFLKFNEKFSKIIEVNFNNIPNNLLHHNIHIRVNGDISNLIDNYVDIKDNFINTTAVACDTKDLYLIILEGIFYFALYIKFINYTDQWIYMRNDNEFFYTSFQIFFHHKISKLFKKLIIDDLLNNPKISFKLMSDSFFKHFINNLDIKGGYIINKDTSSSFSLFKNNNLNIKGGNKKLPSLHTTVKAYNRLYKKNKNK